MRTPLGALIGRLRDGGLDPTAEELADAVWLAQWLPQSGDGGTRASPAPAGDGPAPAADPRDSAHDDGTAPASDPSDPADPSHASDSDGPFGEPSRTAPPADVPLHPAGTPTASGAPAPGLPVRVPAATALPGLLALQQALRPVRRYAPPQPARTGDRRLDEQATAERTAMTGVVTLVHRQARHGRTEIQLLTDDGPTMAVWAPLVDELRQACEQSGVFRDVQVHQLYDHGGDTPLVGTTTGPHRRTRLRSADQLHAPAGRRLTLVVSDCVGPLWQSGAAQRLLNSWPAGSPIAVVQPLPSRMWARTALPAEPGLLRRGPEPAGRTVFESDDAPWLPEVEDVRVVPVLQPTPEAFTAWASLLTGHGGPVRGWAARVAPGPGGGPPSAVPAPAGRSGDELLRAFRATASPGAVRLAVHLAAAPLSLPVMQLVQRTMLPDTGPMELAEVLLGGLLRQLPGTEDRPCFVFPDRVQELLLASLERPAAGLVLKHCSAFVERHFDKGTRNFAALAAARLAGQGAEDTAPEAAGALDDDSGDGRPVGGVETELFATIPARVLRFYQPDLVTTDPLHDAERLLGRFHAEHDTSVLLRAREQAELALAGGSEEHSTAGPADPDRGMRARLVLGRVLRAEAGTARVRGTEHGTGLLREADAVLADALRATDRTDPRHTEAALEVSAVRYELWRATGDDSALGAALDAVGGDPADWPDGSRRALRLRRGRLLIAAGRPAEAVVELQYALELLDAEDAPQPVRCQALLDLAAARSAAGAHPGPTRTVLGRAERAAGDDPVLRLRCLTALAELAERTGDHAEVDDAYARAARLAPADGADRGRLLTAWGTSLLRRATSEHGAAHVDRAESILREALTSLPARAAERGLLLGLVGCALAHRYRHLGFLPDLFESRHLLVQSARAAPEAAVRAEARLQLGRVVVELRRRTGSPALNEALLAYREAEREARDAAGGRTDSATVARALHGQGGVHELMGRTGAARSAYGEAGAIWLRRTAELGEVDWHEVELTRRKDSVDGVPDGRDGFPGADRLTGEEWDRASPPWCAWSGPADG